jgi:hypothetical protein
MTTLYHPPCSLMTSLNVGVSVEQICFISYLFIPPQGPTFVGTRSGAPEVPELPSALGWGITRLPGPTGI